jgi:hypothetical protein
MVGFFGLLFVALASAFAMVWLIGYAPIHSKLMGVNYSPRLFICRFLIPIDVTMTTIMVLGPWIVGADGLGHCILAVFTSLGLTAGTVLIRKIFVPRWRQVYQQECGSKAPVAVHL